MYSIMKEDVFEMDTSILLKQIQDIFGIDTKCDFVISNPPFGIQSIKNADTYFLKKALEIAEDGIFTMHKSSTIEYLRKLINEDKNGKFTIYNETFTEFDIPKTYKFHKEDSKNIDVVFLDIINKECI